MNDWLIDWLTKDNYETNSNNDDDYNDDDDVDVATSLSTKHNKTNFLLL